MRLITAIGCVLWLMAVFLIEGVLCFMSAGRIYNVAFKYMTKI